MKRLTFSMPLFSLIPAGVIFLMAWACVIIVDMLRFTACPAWASLPTPPPKTAVLMGAVLKQLFIQSPDGAVYCFKKNKWSACPTPTYTLHPTTAPDWMLERIGALPNLGAPKQIIRTGDYYEINYYAFSNDGRLWTCPTNIEAEMSTIFNSGAVAWLLIPLLPGGWGLATFLKLFIEYGQPTLWDFWSGRGTRIK